MENNHKFGHYQKKTKTFFAKKFTTMWNLQNFLSMFFLSPFEWKKFWMFEFEYLRFSFCWHFEEMLDFWGLFEGLIETIFETKLFVISRLALALEARERIICGFYPVKTLKWKLKKSLKMIQVSKENGCKKLCFSTLPTTATFPGHHLLNFSEPLFHFFITVNQIKRGTKTQKSNFWFVFVCHGKS